MAYKAKVMSKIKHFTGKTLKNKKINIFKIIIFGAEKIKSV